MNKERPWGDVYSPMINGCQVLEIIHIFVIIFSRLYVNNCISPSTNTYKENV